MTVPAHIFREYDIRGVVGEDLTPDLARDVGRAYGSALLEAIALKGEEAPGQLRKPQVAVGHDNRPSSPELVGALMDGLVSTGVDVLDLGVVPTPVSWWAEKVLETDGAIQVTGSHNPPEWNGIKMTRLGRSLYGAGVQDLLRRIESGSFQAGHGVRTPHPVLDDYVEDVAGRFDLSRSVKVAVDCGNGTGAVVAQRLLEAAGAEVLPLYCTSDGTFPNHHPDPTVDEYLEDLMELVRSEGAEVGVAFDGDADRIGVVDEKGQVVRGDTLLLLYGLDLLERRGPGQLLIYDVKCSQALPEAYDAAGGRSLMWKTGHSLIKEKMLETGAPLAGELSGHICFADDYLGIDDALYNAIRLLDLLASGDTPLSRRVAALPSYESTPEIRIEVTEEEKVQVVQAAREHFGRTHEVVDVDGARILFGDGWALLRSSNTQPVIVARFEARTEERLAEIRSEVEDWLVSRGVDV
ncbi:MAG: phosphomannomutase/phosphoglucomutase [Gemmatimonadales bacterium]|nr:MAG: phosphomannomutase/phosphoglucomutase [Gemmatimonadales bacterium]